MCHECNHRAGYNSYPDTYTYDKMWHKCKGCGAKWFTMNEKEEKPMTRIDLTPQTTINYIAPIIFFNKTEEVIITDDEIRVLRDIQILYYLATKTEVNINIHLKILKIRVIRNSHKVSLKLAKDIVEYLDATILKG